MDTTRKANQGTHVVKTKYSYFAGFGAYGRRAEFSPHLSDAVRMTAKKAAGIASAYNAHAVTHESES